jgi:phenylpropionate dioxygenase-like ring-hydroxylating dioxygenase large terminal subunit
MPCAPTNGVVRYFQIHCMEKNMNPILPGAPWLIAHKSMLSANKPVKITLNGHDYVLWQNQKGEVFALDNVCPHMQAPLSAGWICKDRNTIACPFHALEFDGEGRLYREGKTDGQAIAKPLKLIVLDDYIWTYGGFEPKIPVPDLISKLKTGLNFLGVTGIKSIKGSFLDNLLINYDYNHQNGTHRELFKIKANHIASFEYDGYWAKVIQELYRDDNTLSEIFSNPALLIAPKMYTGTLEYAFPSLTAFQTQTPVVELLQTHVLYPETENSTKTFVLVYTKIKLPGLNVLLKNYLLKAVATVVEQDTTAIENLYHREKAKIRLPNEEIMFHAENLYHNW